MNKGIQIGLATAKPLRLIAVILSVSAGRLFNAQALTKTNLHSFAGSPNDGGVPEPGLVQGSDGSFYGTTFEGGSTNCGSFGCGTVFRIDPDGTYTNLYSFTGPPNDGRGPQAALVQGSDGNFYGTTQLGGSSTNCGSGCGTVFRISPDGTYTNLYSFTGSPKDGEAPYGVLVQGTNGNFYGTTVEGGSSTNCGSFGCGTVYRISPDGVETNLHSFVSSPKEGQSPYAGLVPGSDGNFYGTTYEGGATNCSCGTMYRISPGGAYTNLYSFSGFPKDGAEVYAGLVRGSDGDFYGTTTPGGTQGHGTAFRITPSGVETNLHSFAGFPNDGALPAGGLIQGSDGNFYGLADSGGTNGSCSCGTVFRITPSGVETNLYSFVGPPVDGAAPSARLVQGSDGSFYGTTQQGGTTNLGIVFKLTISLNPPPNQISDIQFSPTNIVFKISSVAGETYQLQFSSSMQPTNWVNIPGVSLTNSLGSLLTLTNSGAAVGLQGFYRFDITP